MASTSFFEKISSHLPVFGFLRARWKEKDYLFVLAFVDLFLFLSCYLLLNKKPWNLVSNTLLLIFLFLGAWRILKRGLPRLNMTVFTLALFGVWGCVASWVVGVFTYLPALHSLLFLCIYLNLMDIDYSGKMGVFRLVTYCFDIFSLTFFFYYLPYLIRGDFFRFGSFFGNQDYVAVTLSLCVIFNLFLVSQKKYFSLVFALLSAGLEMLTQTRMAFFTILLCALIFLLFIFWKNKVVLLILLSVLVASFFLLMRIESFSGMFKRLLTMIVALLTGNTALDDSIGPRLGVIARTYDLCFSMPFFSFGYDGIVKYGTTTTHDSFGQLAFCGGWIYSAFIHFDFFKEMIFGIKKANRFKLLSMFFLADFLINFFLGTPFYNRYFFVYMPIYFSMVDSYNDRPDPRRVDFLTL